MLINNLPATIINLKDGWIGIEYGNYLFVLDRTKNNKSLKRPRTVFSLITANPSLSATEINDMMMHVTTIYKLNPWTTNKNTRASIYSALDYLKGEHYGVSYKKVIKEWYNNSNPKEINNDKFYPNIITIGEATNHSIPNSSFEPLKRSEENETMEEYIWSITKDQKIKREEIHEYRIENNAEETSTFFVIADGYKFKSGVVIFNAKTKDECIEFIDKLTIKSKEKGTSPC